MTFVVAATLSWIVFLWVIYRARTTDETTIRTWAFVAFFGAATTVQIEPIYIEIGRLSGINNLAWLLSYCLGATAVYTTILTLHEGLKIEKEPVFLRRALYATFLALLLIFPAIARQPNQPDHVNPTTTAEILFMLPLYVFGACACFSISRTFFRLCQQDTVLPSRLRWLVIVLASFAAGLYFTSRTTYSAIVFLYPDWVTHPLIAFLEVFYVAAFFGCLGWVFFFLPAGVFQKLAQVVTSVDKWLALRDLNVIQNLIALFYEPIAPPILHHSRWERLQNLDFHLYRAIIVILDGKRALASHFMNVDETFNQNYVILPPNEALVTNPKLAKNLFLALRQVSDNADYWELVAAYRKVGQFCRKGIR